MPYAEKHGASPPSFSSLALFILESYLCGIGERFVIGGGTTSGFKFWVLAYGLFQWATRLKLDSLSVVEPCLGYLFLVYWSVRKL